MIGSQSSQLFQDYNQIEIDLFIAKTIYYN